MAVLAARAADAGALHDKLIQDWRSIDDVTGDSIMVLAPQPPDERPMWIKAPKEPKALQSSGLGGSHLGQSSDWSKRFWNAYPVVEPDAAAFWRAPEPVDERQARAGFTSSASEIARYFRLEEADLPCLAIVSFWDRNLLIIGPGALAAHGPYELFRRFVQAYGPPPRWRRIHAEQEEMRLTQARLERELRRSQAASIDGSHNWCAQRDAVLKALAALAPQLDADLRADAARIDALLRKGDAPADGDMAAAARLLHKAGKESRLGHKLPRALAKLPVVPKDPTVAMRNADRAAELRREIVSAQERMQELSAAKLDAVERFCFAPAVLRAGAALGLAERERSPWRAGWTTLLLDQPVVDGAQRLHRIADNRALDSGTRSEQRAVILCAIRDELLQVRRQLEVHSPVVLRPAADESVYLTSRFEGKYTDWQLAAVATSQTNYQAASATVGAIMTFDPQVVLFVGIAGSLDPSVALGDVVVADRVHDYEVGKDTEAGFRVRPLQQVPSHRLLQWAIAVSTSEAWHERVLTTSPVSADGPLPRVHVEPIAAGGKVVASAKSHTFELLGDAAPRAVAVEMEGAGFLAAAHRFPRAQSLLIRGISDSLDDKAESDRRGWRHQAAANATAFAIELLAVYSA
jgi:nucleoside phosphorylase